MKARVHFETPTHNGNFEIEEPESFRGWLSRVGEAGRGNSWPYFIGDRIGFPLRYITMIEKLED